MSNSEGSARVFAGIATFFGVFFLPKLIVPIFEESSLTVLWGLVALAAAWVAVCLVSLKQRVKRLEMQTYYLQTQLEKLDKHSDEP